MIGILSPDLSISGLDCGGLNVPNVGHHLDESLARLARRKRHGVADHVRLAAGARMRSLRRARRVIVANNDVFGLHTHFMGGDLRKNRQDALADLGNPGNDFRAAAIVDFGPGSRAIDHGGARNAVPARRHSSSAFARHLVTPPLPASRLPQNARPAHMAAEYLAG